jgi:hypothetical protein
LVADLPPTTREEDRWHEPITVVVVAVVIEAFQFVCCCRSKSDQLLIAIFPTVFRGLIGIGQKAPTKMTTKASIQEIFAEFVVGVKESQAQWYSVKPLQKEIPSLADLLEVSADNLQSLFVQAGFGKLGGQDKKTFSFQASKFESFRSVFTLQDSCKATHRKVRGFKTKQWFVRLGTHYVGDLPNPGTKGRAPRIQNIRAVRCDFQDAVTKLPCQLHSQLQQVLMKRFAMLAKLIVSCYFVLMATSVASGQNDFILLPRFRKKTRQFRNRVLILERYLGMSITTKSHLAEDHSCEQQEDFDGQLEGTAACQTARRQRRLDARDDVLTSPAPEGRMITLRNRRVLKLREA